MGKRKRNRSSPQPSSIQSLSDADIERLSNAITKAILDVDRLKNNNATTKEYDPSSRSSRLTLLGIKQVFFGNLKKLKIQNSAVSLVKLITSMTCSIIKWIGYVFAILFFVVCVIEAVISSSIANAIICLSFSQCSIIVWLIARLVGAAGIEIEESNNPDLIFGISSFFLSIIAIVISLNGLR